ncbi:hypothetical protein Leryth_023469 [Lithospermum erythrorhizon]|nr:hypothetical protein Leryth_023469 [Lithospermum erythrorhizon]
MLAPSKGPLYPPSLLQIVIVSRTSFAHKWTATIQSIMKLKNLNVLANDALKADKYSQAIDLYTKAIELNSGNAVTHTPNSKNVAVSSN